MKVYHSIEEFKSKKNSIVTVGTFDGVHIGHKKIIDKLTTIAKEENGETVLLTFSPHPRLILQKECKLKLINTQKEKIELLESYGLNHLIIHPFNKDFSRMSSLSFVRDILVNSINVKKLVIGYNHHFGRNREGNHKELIEYSNIYEFQIEKITKETLDNISISSTKIRKALESGDIEVANHFLGYPFSLCGKVTQGNKIGRTLGFPTANIHIDDQHKILPKNGSYAIHAYIRGQLKYGMLNIGINPTIKNFENTKNIEVHIFNFSKYIYQENINLKFISFIRDEQKFKSLELLKNQLKKDKIKSLELLKNKSLNYL